MIGSQWRSRGTPSTWSRLPQDVSGRWHGYPLLARVSFLKERGKGKRVGERERERVGEGVRGREEDKHNAASQEERRVERREERREERRARRFQLFPFNAVF